MGVLGPPATVEHSRELGRAAVMAMLAIAKTAPGAVLDSTFYPYTVPHLGELPGSLIELRCRCPRRWRRRGTGRGAGPGTAGTSTTTGRPRSCGTSTTPGRSASVR